MRSLPRNFSLVIFLICCVKAMLWIVPTVAVPTPTEVTDIFQKDQESIHKVALLPEQQDAQFGSELDDHHEPKEEDFAYLSKFHQDLIVKFPKDIDSNRPEDPSSRYMLEFDSSNSMSSDPASDDGIIGKGPPVINHTAPGYCSFRGGSGKKLPIIYAGPATSEPITYCAKYFDSDKYCCDFMQDLAIRQNMLELSSLFGSCPSCMENFERFWCSYTCSPNQSMFTNVVDYYYDPLRGYVVNSTMFSLDTNYAQAFFNSCNYVKFTGTGASPMKFVFNADNYQEFFPNMGKQGPYLINFNFSYGNGTLDAVIDPCNATCSCNNCPTACPLPLPGYSDDQPSVNIGGLHLRVVSLVCICLGIVFAAGFLVGILVIVFVVFRKKRRGLLELPINEEEEDESKDIRVVEEKENLGYINKGFYLLGKFCAEHYYVVMGIAFALFIAFALGFLFLEVNTNPNTLWSSPSDKVADDTNYFNDMYTPFYRIEQVIFGSKNGSIITKENFIKILKFQKLVEEIRADYNGQTVMLTDICNYPFINAPACMVQTPNGFWQNSMSNLVNESFVGILEACVHAYSSNTSCFDNNGIPVMPNVVFANYPGVNVSLAEYVVVTFLVNNYENSTFQNMAMAWESEFLKIFTDEYVEKNILDGLTYFYSAQRSIPDALSSETTTNIPPVVISYLVMFLYVSLALGSYFPFVPNFLVVQSKFLLGLGGIAIVIIAVTVSVGFYSYLGVQATLIISEVIPFLVLAIGVDNVFILVGAMDEISKKRQDLPIEDRLGKTLAKVGTSIAMATLSECIAFGAAALTNVPAVRTFALYAFLAILVDSCLQTTAFVSFMALDAYRARRNAVDCLPCITVAFQEQPGEDAEPMLYNPTVSNQKPKVGGKNFSLVRHFFKTYYTPFILHPVSKVVILMTFTAMILLGVNYASLVQQGLNQTDTVPDNSYLVPYLNAVSFDLEVGSPLYFIVKGTYNYSDLNQQDRICSITGCDTSSLGNVVGSNLVDPSVSHVASALMNWVDEYLLWLQSETCCRLKTNRTLHLNWTALHHHIDVLGATEKQIETVQAWTQDIAIFGSDTEYDEMYFDPDPYRWVEDDFHHKFGPHFNLSHFNWTKILHPPSNTSGPYCDPEHDLGTIGCKLCMPKHEAILHKNQSQSHGRPTPEVFMQFLPQFIFNSTCGVLCGFCGTGYQSDLIFNEDYSQIESSRFMTYATPSPTSQDFIDSLKMSYDISNSVNDQNEDVGLTIIPYCYPLLFFSQYLGLDWLLLTTLGIAFLGVFLVTLIMLRNLILALIVMVLVLCIEIDIMGMMYIWDVQLNALSMVNLVMAIGISVEFCIHITHAFADTADTHNTLTRDQRVIIAMEERGSSVFSGIFMTKLCGVSVLAFASSKIFTIYYFRMFMLMVIFGGLYGLVLLPVVLSLFGPTKKGSFFF